MPAPIRAREDAKRAKQDNANQSPRPSSAPDNTPRPPTGPPPKTATATGVNSPVDSNRQIPKTPPKRYGPPPSGPAPEPPIDLNDNQTDSVPACSDDAYTVREITERGELTWKASDAEDDLHLASLRSMNATKRVASLQEEYNYQVKLLDSFAALPRPDNDPILDELNTARVRLESVVF